MRAIHWRLGFPAAYKALVDHDTTEAAMPIAFLLATLAAQAAAAPAVLDPPAAIALAEAHPERANSGIFRVTVAATDRNLKAVFLNSTPDYRGADDVTTVRHLTR